MRASFVLSLVALLATGCALPRADEHAAVRDEIPAKARVGGKYSNLLTTIEVPDDVRSYGEFNDWGWWSGTSYAGRENLPPGYWVYVSPYWYVWGTGPSRTDATPPVWFGGPRGNETRPSEVGFPRPR